MENETQNYTAAPYKKDRLLSASVVFFLVVVAAGAWIYTTGLKSINNQEHGLEASLKAQVPASEEKMFPSEGVVLPARWGDLGIKLINAGVIDQEKFESLYASRGGLTENEQDILYGEDNENLIMTVENSDFLLNIFWALGLGAKNDILDKGPMSDLRYGGAENFASTGGWTLASGDVMNHYGRHILFTLTPEQQVLVEKVSKNIYRPCCNNPTHFPDCNHGMAMLGLLELMASQGISEEEMYKVALQVNSYWFPDTYLTIARYLDSTGADLKTISPKELLGKDYSSGSGYQRILDLVSQPTKGSGGGCAI